MVPEFQHLAYLLRSRWTRPLRDTAIVVATASTGARLGGRGGRQPRRSETTHDLHLAAVYLKLRRENLRLAARWVSEALIQAEGGGQDEKLPDALIRLRSGTTAIEFGGVYSARKLAEFHEHCASHGFAYEVW